jgi:hypothetical protein
MDHLSFAGNAASIIGLIMTIWVSLQVRGLRQQYLLQARSPALLKRIDFLARDLGKLLLLHSTESHEFDVALKRTEAALNNLGRKLPRSEAGRARKLSTNIGKLARPIARQDVEPVYADLIGIAEAVRQLQQDTLWMR